MHNLSRKSFFISTKINLHRLVRCYQAGPIPIENGRLNSVVRYSMMLWFVSHWAKATTLRGGTSLLKQLR